MTAAEFQARRSLPTVVHTAAETLVLAEMPTVGLRKLAWAALRKPMFQKMLELQQPGAIVAMIRELRRRPGWASFEDGGTWHNLIHHCSRYDPPPCACGRPGLFIVGIATYCRQCRGKATSHRVKWSKQIDARHAEVEKMILAKEREIDEARKHHLAVGRNPSQSYRK